MESLFSAMHDQLLEAALPLLTAQKPEGTLTHRAKTLVSARRPPCGAAYSAWSTTSSVSYAVLV